MKVKLFEQELYKLILISIAAEEEIGHLKKSMSVKEKIKDGKVLFLKGQIEQTEVVLVKTGIGSKKARSSISKAIDRFRPSLILLIGAAGAVNPELHIGDIVVVDAIKEIHSKKISTYRCSAALNSRIMDVLKREGFSPILHDCMVFSNFIHMKQEKQTIMSNYDVMVIDMESAGVAKEASLRNVPLVDIRIVSDTAREDTLNVEKIYREKKRKGIAGLFLYFLINPLELKKALLLRKHLFTVSERIKTVTELLLKNSFTDKTNAPEV